ncbi:uncharacterized protein [Triticum aestivum]|uniref:uncharacterized protein n=1 Tax=Triticum aestivum TaxID=4565 RepID=UPI001D031A7B|nr:uncharacterized protein LOC123169422 [Triticum aestivum]
MEFDAAPPHHGWTVSPDAHNASPLPPVGLARTRLRAWAVPSHTGSASPATAAPPGCPTSASPGGSNFDRSRWRRLAAGQRLPSTSALHRHRSATDLAAARRSAPPPFDRCGSRRGNGTLFTSTRFIPGCELQSGSEAEQEHRSSCHPSSIGYRVGSVIRGRRD